MQDNNQSPQISQEMMSEVQQYFHFQSLVRDLTIHYKNQGMEEYKAGETAFNEAKQILWGKSQKHKETIDNG